MTRGFRHEPALGRLDRYVRRPRLVQLLRRRFEHRLTLVTAPGGSGKSTALALAIESNRLDPIGEDVWLGAETDDADPGHLAAGLGAALGVDVEHRIDQAVAALVNELWRRAPDDVAIVVDDVHLVGPGGSHVLTELLGRLPANGHLVLAGRHRPDVPLGRLRARGELLEVGPAELDLDDDEIDRLLVARGPGDGSIGAAALPRMPALAELELMAGSTAQIEFVWEEVLAGLPPDRLEALVLASVPDELDDDLARALSNGRYDASELVEGLPLVESSVTGEHRLHALLRSALAGRIEPDRRVKAARLAAEVEDGRGNLAAVVALLAECDDTTGAVEAARRFVQLPVLRRSYEQQSSVRRIVDSIQPGTALARLLEIECRWGHGATPLDYDELNHGFLRIAEAARAQGDDAIEAVAVYRALEGFELHARTAPLEVFERLTELAESEPFAVDALRHSRARWAQELGDPDASVAHLHSAEVRYPDLEQTLRAGRLCDLGRPEEVAVGLGPDDLASLPRGAEVLIAFAMWLRGEVSPEVAFEIGQPMTADTVARRMVNQSVSILGVTSIIALAAGRTDVARAQVREAHDLAAWGSPDRIRLFALVADAALASVEEGDEAAAERLAQATELVPFAGWPSRAHLLVLPLLYLTRPESRQMLDGCRFGRSITTAVDAGRLLVDVRDRGTAASVDALPWHDVDLLRAHVLPHHLCELALVARERGVAEASTVLDALPLPGQQLARVASAAHPTVRQLATARLGAVPVRPAHAVSIATLGRFELARDDEWVTDEDWVRRSRVRQLLALLVDHRRIERVRAAALLWPELADDKALANLRVNLTHLQRVLEPERHRYAAPYYLRVESEQLVLARDVDLDVDVFEERMRRAIRQDRAGALVEALELYRSALGAYGGDYLPGFDDEAFHLTRLRLRSLAVSGACRVGELIAARGEPEEAAEWAVRAQRDDGRNERAARLLAACLLAGGDRSAACVVLDDLVAALTADGLEPEADTVRLRQRLSGRI